MKERIKRRIALAKAEFRETYFSLMTGDTSCITRADRISMFIGIPAIMLVLMSGQTIAFASGGGIIEDLGGTADDIMNSFRSVASKFALVALGACIIWFFMCTNDEDAKRPLKWGKRVILAYIVFMLLDAIIGFIDDKTAKY